MGCPKLLSLLDFNHFDHRVRSPSRARLLRSGNVEFIYVSALLFCSRFMGQIGTTVGQGLFLYSWSEMNNIIVIVFHRFSLSTQSVCKRLTALFFCQWIPWPRSQSEMLCGDTKQHVFLVYWFHISSTILPYPFQNPVIWCSHHKEEVMFQV